MPIKSTKKDAELVEKKSTKTEFEVFTSVDGYVRTYSIETHGADAEKLANEYAQKINGKVR